MSGEYTRRETLALVTALGVGVGSSTGLVSANPSHGHSNDHDHGPNGPTLNRLATTVASAEFTGLFLTNDGQLFFNVQHPSPPAEKNYLPGAVGAITGADVTDLPADFESVQPPKGPATDVRTAVGTYQVFAEGGDRTKNGEQLGVPYSASGTPMTNGGNPDFNGFIPADDASDEGYLFTNWETTPGMVSRLHITQASNTSEWTVLEQRNLDFRPVKGTWTNCFGTVSPWATPLTSEEYEPDAQSWFTTGGSGAKRMKTYLGEFGNAYRYGYIVEIEDPQGDPTPVKRYAMGRFSHENSVVMPDEQTVYLSDDGTGTVFFKFIADEPGDLSAGTLYAARANQQRGDNPAEVGFTLDWLELAHATEEEVESWIAEYDDQQPSPNANYITDEEVTAWANGNAPDDRVAFLESRKAAAAVGATDEFRKMEGVNIRDGAQPGDFLYMAMSEINQTMADNKGDLQLEGENYGAVYRMRLQGNYDVRQMEPVVVGGDHATICGGCPYDANPNTKSSVCQDCAFNPNKEKTEHNSADQSAATNARGMQKATTQVRTLAGRGMTALAETSESIDSENTIANPDNLVVMPDGRVIIGEDSGIHSPDMLWIYTPSPGQS
jgi:secreted PhoX family phosphatase